MALFKRKRKGTIKSVVKVADIFVVKAEIVSSYTRDLGHMRTIMYFLAKCDGNEYFELFSGTKLEKVPQPENGIVSQSFNTPYIKKVEPFRQYLKYKNERFIDIQTLFEFITNMNVVNTLNSSFDKSSERISTQKNRVFVDIPSMLKIINTFKPLSDELIEDESAENDPPQEC